MKIKIGIIILHFGRWEVTKDCLDSLLKLRTQDLEVKVVIVNNALDKEVVKKIKLHPVVDVVLEPQENLGFAGGNNLGIKKGKELYCEYVLFLNNDTVVEPEFLEAMVVVGRERSRPFPTGEIGILGPVIEHQVRGQTLYDYGGYIDWKKGQPRHENKKNYSKTRHPGAKTWPSAKSSDRIPIDYLQFNEILSVAKALSRMAVIPRDFVSGCCMLVPMAILDQIGGFDESYFLYLEDVELCLRAKKAGFETALVPGAKIFHKGSQSATELTKIFYSWRNSLELIRDYAPWPQKFTAGIYIMMFYPLVVLKMGIKRLI